MTRDEVLLRCWGWGCTRSQVLGGTQWQGAGQALDWEMLGGRGAGGQLRAQGRALLRKSVEKRMYAERPRLTAGFCFLILPV